MKKRKQVKKPSWIYNEEEVMLFNSIRELLPIKLSNTKASQIIERDRLEEHLWLISCNITGIKPTDTTIKEKFLEMMFLID